MEKMKILFIVSLSLFISLISFAQSANKSVSVRVGNIMVADRNVGAQQGGIARNYTNNEDHPDHKNLSFKGAYYTWTQALTICPKDWRLPTKKEMDLIENAIQFSGGRSFLADSDGNQCYFSFSGYSDYPSYVHGIYWSSSEGDHYGDYAWLLRISPNSSLVYYSSCKSDSFSVRCVKSLSEK